MMNMANTTGWHYGLTALWGVHALAMIAFGVGLLFILFWAFKHLNTGQLRNWGIGLFVVGAAVCLVTIGVRGAPWGFPMDGGGGMKCPMMEKMMESGNGMKMQGMEENGMGMSMMLKGKTGDDFDRAFIKHMIPHHQDAIDMANMALENAKHEEMKTLARDIISAQQREIDQMKQWQQAWGYSQ